MSEREASGYRDIRIWFRAVRAFSFTASIIPVAIGAALAAGTDARWGLTPLVAFGCVLIHAGTNLVSDAADYRRGVDRPDTHGGSGVLVEGLLSGDRVYRGGLFLLGAGSMLGLALAVLCDWPVLVMGVIGVIGGFFYGGRSFGYKYVALGDVMVFFLMGPLIVVGTYYVLVGDVSLRATLASLPVACLVTAILYSNNFRDIRHDSACGVLTLVGLLGARRGRFGYYLLVVGAYGLTAGLTAFGILTPWVLLTFASLPLAMANVAVIRRADPENAAAFASIDVKTAKLHLVFGVLMSAGVMLGAVP